MKDIPPSLTKEIDALPDAENRLSKKMLIITVYVMAGVISILFAMIISGWKTNRGDDKKRIVQLESDVIEERKKTAYKDSLYTNCLINAARREDQVIEEKTIRKEEKEFTLRIQDSLLRIINSRPEK